MYGRAGNEIFSILSQNVRSLGGKFDQLREYVGRYGSGKITCIMLQEVWSVGRMYSLPGYHNLEYNTRDKNQNLNSNCGGGVGIYISISLDYEVLQFKNEFIEGVYKSIWVKVYLGHGKTKILGCVYRPNTSKGDINKAISVHESILQDLRSDKVYKQSDLLVFSDFNADLLNYDRHQATTKYVDLQLDLGLLPLITKPTRKYHNSATLIDHIFATKTNTSISVGVLEDSDLSDHFGTAYTEDLQIMKNKESLIPIRKITKHATQVFIEQANAVNWDAFENEEHDQTYYQKILNSIHQAVNKAFPLKLSKPSKVKISPPWFSGGLLEASKHKQKLYRNYRKKPTPLNELEYKNYRSVYQRIHRKAKLDYYNNKFEKYAKNIKETWRVLKEAVGLLKKTSFKFPDYFWEEAVNKPRTEDGGNIGNAPAHPVPPPPPEPPPKAVKTKITDKNSIAEGFNNYYTSIGNKLSSQIRDQNFVPDFEFQTHVKQSKNSFSFQEVGTELILSIVQLLQNKTSSGTDGMSNVMLKTIAPYIIKPMHNIFNRSLKNGTVPEDFKCARVIPIYKGKESGSPFEYTNYRPISLLQSMSRVLEKLVDRQLRNYLTMKMSCIVNSLALGEEEDVIRHYFSLLTSLRHIFSIITWFLLHF